MKISTNHIIIGAALLGVGAYAIAKAQAKKTKASAPAVPAAINPQPASTAPERNTDWNDVLANMLGQGASKLMDKWLDDKPQAGQAGAIFRNQDVMGPDPLAVQNAAAVDDSVGAWFGGVPARFNWDNVGGSIFDGLPSIGTGVAVD